MVNTSSHHSGYARARVPLGFIVPFRCWCELYRISENRPSAIICKGYERGTQVKKIIALRETPNWAVNIADEFQAQIRIHDARSPDVRPVPQRGLSRKLRNCLPRGDQRRRWGVPHRSVASRRKIAPLGRILWSRRRKRAAKITAKTAPAVSFTRAADRASGNVQKPGRASEEETSHRSTFPEKFSRRTCFLFLLPVTDHSCFLRSLLHSSLIVPVPTYHLHCHI